MDGDMKLDLAHARQRELIAAGESARMGRRSPEPGDRRAVVTRPAAGTLGGWAERRRALAGLLLSRTRLSAVREQDPC